MYNLKQSFRLLVILIRECYIGLLVTTKKSTPVQCPVCPVHCDIVIGLTPHSRCLLSSVIIIIIIITILTEGPNMGNATYNSRELNFRLCKYKVPVLAVKARGGLKV